MKKKSTIKNVTIDDLAEILEKRFDKIDTKFESVDTKFNSIYNKLGKIEVNSDSIKDDIKDIKLGNYSSRMDKIEDKMLMLQTGVEKHLKIKFQK